MKNSGSFKNIGKDLASEYEDGIKVLLESTDDEYIIGRKWFSKLKDKISFESVSGTKENGGCAAVVTKVTELNKSNKKVYGIVDRDILLNDPNFQHSLWWELDNHTFTTAQPYGENIFVLHRWELENYLFHPQVLESRIAKKKLTHPPAITAATIADLLIANEDELVAVTLLSTIPAKTATAQVSEKFGLHDKNKNLINVVSTQLSLNSTVFSGEREKIIRFAEGEASAIHRWDKLSRMLDGKRIMHRISQLLSASTVANIKIDLETERDSLATDIANNNLVDVPLSNWLIEIYDERVSF